MHWEHSNNFGGGGRTYHSTDHSHYPTLQRTEDGWRTGHQDPHTSGCRQVTSTRSVHLFIPPVLLVVQTDEHCLYHTKVTSSRWRWWNIACGSYRDYRLMPLNRVCPTLATLRAVIVVTIICVTIRGWRYRTLFWNMKYFQ